jgi:hypothetical protein
MAIKKSAKVTGDGKQKAPRTKPETTPKFPYTTKPGSLRRLLKDIPQKPKPPKFDKTQLKNWGFSDANDYSMLRVLKAVNLLDDKNVPTEAYGRFMDLDDGGKALGPEIRKVYAPMFEASYTPYSESNEKLQNLFNIHSGGGEKALAAQIQTFKALCEFAAFDQPADGTSTNSNGVTERGSSQQSSQNAGDNQSQPTININIHIHLPENKSRREYEDIIEDIGRYIFGRNTGERHG